jgi:cation transport regulator
MTLDFQQRKGGEAMPYRKTTDLPDSVKDNLPAHAQEIYKEAFNHAYKEYKEPAKRRGSASREETAHKVAWSAVKKAYHKKGEQWVRDSE